MRRQVARTVLIAASMAPWNGASTAWGQIFARPHSDQPASVPNRSCGVLGCPPQTMTWGHFHEHWRRWPEEHIPPGEGKSLSPFTVPDRTVPPATTPDPRDEGSLAPRTRSAPAPPAPGLPARSPASGAPSQPPATTPRTPATAPERLELPDDLPSTPATVPPTGDAAAPQDGQFFPEIPPADGDEGLPDSLPFDTDAAPTPPAGTGAPTPGTGAEPATDDIFNPDDFGQIDHQRLRRYRSGSVSKLRRAGRSGPNVVVAGEQTREMQLVSHESSIAERRNPLRNRLTSGPAGSATKIEPTTVQAVAREIPSASSEPESASMRLEPLEFVTQPFAAPSMAEDTSVAEGVGESVGSRASVRPAARNNPLRRG